MKHLIARKMSAYDLLNNNTFKRSRVNPVCHGTEPMSYPSPKLCDVVPNEVKNAFKFKIKRWAPDGCPCRKCKIYLGRAGL